MSYEDYIEELENFPSQEALEAAAEALAFVQNLNTLLRDNGAKLPETPDCDKIGNILDSVFGELSAASLFLSEDTFKQVPKMLRVIAKQFEEMDTEFTDPNGETGPSVPTSVVRGYSGLADRIEAARKQKVAFMALLQQHLTEKAQKDEIHNEIS